MRPVVLAEWSQHASRYRLVDRSPDAPDVHRRDLRLEHLEHDALGAERWTDLELPDCRGSNDVARILLAGVYELGRRNLAVAATMDYSKGHRQG